MFSSFFCTFYVLYLDLRLDKNNLIYNRNIMYLSSFKMPYVIQQYTAGPRFDGRVIVFYIFFLLRCAICFTKICQLFLSILKRQKTDQASLTILSCKRSLLVIFEPVFFLIQVFTYLEQFVNIIRFVKAQISKGVTYDKLVFGSFFK